MGVQASTAEGSTLVEEKVSEPLAEPQDRTGGADAKKEPRRKGAKKVSTAAANPLEALAKDDLKAAALQGLAGTWMGEDGQVYCIKETEWKVTRKGTRGKARTFGINWNEKQSVIYWGNNYFAANVTPKDLHVGWYQSRDLKRRHRQFLWERQCEIPKDEPTDPFTLQRDALLRHRHLAEGPPPAMSLPAAVAVDSQVTYVAEEPELEQRRPRTRKPRSSGLQPSNLNPSVAEFVPSLQQAAASESQMDTVLAALQEATVLAPSFDEPKAIVNGPFVLSDALLGKSNREQLATGLSQLTCELRSVTTVLIQGMADTYKRDELRAQLDKNGFEGTYDVLHVPLLEDSKGATYGFINFWEPSACHKIVNEFHGFEVKKFFPESDSSDLLNVTYTVFQGRQAILLGLCHETCVRELKGHPERQPLVWDIHGNEEDYPPKVELGEMQEDAADAEPAAVTSFVDLAYAEDPMSYMGESGLYLWDGWALPSFADWCPQKDDHLYTIDTASIYNGKDDRTTVMVRGMSRFVTPLMLANFLELCGLEDRYTFLYVGSDKRKNMKTGVSVINFTAPSELLQFCAAMATGMWYGNLVGQVEMPEVKYARVQRGENEDDDQIVTTKHGESSTEDSESAKPGRAQQMMKRSEGDVGSFHRSSRSSSNASEEQGYDSEHKLATLADDTDKHLVMMQVEFYFSVENICHDKYLRSLMDEQGWVKTVDILPFPRLKKMNLTEQAITDAMKWSTVLQLSKDKTQLQIRNATVRHAFGHIPASAVTAASAAKAAAVATVSAA